MKATKKTLKETFGDTNEAVSYLKSLRNGQKAPVLFVYGSKSQAFIQWLSNVVTNAQLMDTADFNSSFSTLSSPVALVKADGEIEEETVQASVQAMRNGVNVIIATSGRPKILDYISDPTLKMIRVDEFDSDAMMSEIPELKGEL